MNADYINSADALKKLMGIDGLTQYENFIPFERDKYGFSIQRAYPSNIAFKPPVTKGGQPDTVALIRVLYKHPDSSGTASGQERIPMIIDIGAHSRYLYGRFDYNFEDKDCPTEVSVRRSKATPKPINLDFTGEFFYDHKTSTFVNAKGKTIASDNILEQVFQKHCDTIHKIKALKLRSKLLSKNILFKLCGLIIEGLKSILKLITGRTFEPDEYGRGLFQKYKIEDMKLVKTDSIEVFGYKASKNVIVTFSLSILTIYTISYFKDINSPYWEKITTNPLLGICASLCLLWVIDHLLTRLTFHVINSLITIKYKLITMRFKF